jgi:hypothetical protein
MSLKSKNSRVFKGLIFASLLAAISGCASGHCNKYGKANIPNDQLKIFVFKYDGSRQCEPQSGVSKKEMSKELSEITIYSSEKKSDGQVRVQVCGALSGYANVYKIKKKDLSLAEALGFKKWDF